MDNLASFTDILSDEIPDSQPSPPMSLPSSHEIDGSINEEQNLRTVVSRPVKGTGQHGQFRSVEEIDPKYRGVFKNPYFNLVQSSVIEDALYSDKSMVVCAPTGSGKTVIFEMAIVQLLIEYEEKRYTDDFKIIYMAPVKALCTERLSEWYPKFTRLGLLCIVVTGDTDVDFSQLKPYKIIITTPEKWDMLTRRWRDHRSLVDAIKLFLIDEVHILNEESRGPALEVVVSRMKTIESSAQCAYGIEQFKKKYENCDLISEKSPPRIRFLAVSATVSNPDDVATWIGDTEKPAVFYKFGDECRPVKLNRVVEGYPCYAGTSIFKFDIALNFKLRPIIQKYHNGKPTLIFCNTRKGVELTAEMLSREITLNFSQEQKLKLVTLASSLKNKKLQNLITSGIGCHHAGLLFEERTNIEQAFRNRDLPILITTTTLAMGVNLPAHLVIIKNTQQYVNGAYQEYSISTVLQMVGRAGRPQYDTEATAVIMTRCADKSRYQNLVGGCEPLQSYLYKRLPENLNSEVALGSVTDVAQCVQWLRSTFLWVRARRDPKRYLGLPATTSQHLITKKIEELCIIAMNSLASTGLITMDETSCIESTEAGRLMSMYYIDLETMKNVMKIEGNESLERLLCLVCESHELADMHLRVNERRCLNALNRNSTATTIRFPMKGKITTRQMKLNCIIQAILGCLPIPDPSLNQEATKIMRASDRVCKCLVAYVTRPGHISNQPRFFSAVLNSLILAKCITAQLWENSPFLSRQLKGIGPTYSALLASAGKSTFLMLRESHPRDLERIMNKGAPAGNVLLKQICLLPQYSVTMTPNNEKTVTVQLVLQNQSYLAENLNNSTAGGSHKCNIVVGDSENNILLLTSLTDKDFINIYAGSVTYQVTRIHGFEHTVYAHCISSSFVGIDDYCEYTFQDLRLTISRLHINTNAKDIQKKQTLITDSFNERKRKNQDSIVESQGKKKRECAVMEEFKFLKRSLRVPSIELCKNLNNSLALSDKTLVDTVHCNKDNSVSATIISTEVDNIKKNTIPTQIYTEADDTVQFIDQNNINSLLNKIESEISNHQNYYSESDNLNKSFTCNPRSTFGKDTTIPLRNTFASDNVVSTTKLKSDLTKQLMQHSQKEEKVIRHQKQRSKNKIYNFIDLLEKNTNLSDDDEINNTNDDTGFSYAIKHALDSYFIKAKCNSKDSNAIVDQILKISGDTVTPKTSSGEGYHKKSNLRDHIICNEVKITETNMSNTHIDNDIVTQVNTNISIHKENELLQNIHSPVNESSNLRNVPSGSKVAPDNLDNFNNVNNFDDTLKNYVSNIIPLTPAFYHTEIGFKEIDVTNSKNDGIVVPPVRLDSKLSKTINSDISIVQSYNQCNRNMPINENNEIKLIKKYTCTAQQIDSSTSINNQKIHIVKNIRVDLDVTKAVYIGDKYNPKHGNYIYTETSKNKIAPNCTFIATEKKDSIVLFSDAVQEHDEIKSYNLDTSNTVDKLYCPTIIDCARICNREQNLAKTTIEKQMCPDIKESSSYCEMGFKNHEVVPLKELQNDFKSTESQCTNIQSSNEKVTECDNREKNHIPEYPENTTVADILQKYSTLLKESYIERDVVKPNLMKCIDINEKKVKELQNIRRPFNISDIDTTNFSLPNILVNVNPTQTKYISELPEKDTNRYDERYFNDDNPLITTPDLTEEFLDVKIDESMFDPRHLLFFLGKDNSGDIIPPPLEYQDTSRQSSPEDIKIHSDDFDKYNQNIHTLSQFRTENMSNVDDVSDQLEDKEFGILSHDESFEDFGQSNLKPDVIKRIHLPVNNNWRDKGIIKPKGILQQFKFKPKEIMKVNPEIFKNSKFNDNMFNQ